MRVAFVVSDIVSKKEDYSTTEHIDIDKTQLKDYGDMFKAYLEQEHAQNIFKIYTTKQSIIFRSNSVENKLEFTNAIKQGLKELLEPSLYEEKHRACKVNYSRARQQCMHLVSVFSNHVSGNRATSARAIHLPNEA